MPFIKQVGCDCSECGPDACTAGCPCTFDESISITGAVLGVNNFFDVTGEFLIAHDIAVTVTLSGAASSGRVAVYGNYPSGSPAADLIYDSGCVSSSTSGGGTVPAGTTQLRIFMDRICAGEVEASVLATRVQCI